jgi:hypothetical protein
MTTQAWRAADIKGLTPAVDLRRADGVFALGGQNYVFDSLGPKSPFGNRLLSATPLDNPAHAQGLRFQLGTRDRVFYLVDDTLLEWKEETLSYVLIYTFAASSVPQPYRLTGGYLNDKLYFCHPALGLFVLDVPTNTFGRLTGLGVPPDPIACCIDNGRLAVITNEVVAWSAQSDGSNFDPRLGGAGFTKIADRISGSPIMIHSYGRGVLVWTNGGVLKGEFTGDVAVYRWNAINTEFRPINSFCTLQMNDNTIVILDERGLFQSSGENPQPFTPVFNEFLIRYIQKNNLNVGQNIRMEWDAIKRFIYISTSMTFADPLYEKAYVLYPPLDKWGTFNEPHYGILPVKINTSERADDYFGFVGSDSLIRFWRDVGSRQAADGTLVPLDASVQIGLIRFDQLNDANDQMTEVTQIMIGNVQSGTPADLIEDYNLIPPGQDEDYNLLTGVEDFGEDQIAYVNHKTRMIGTIDGVSVFAEEIPSLTLFTRAARHYSCSVNGIWHMLELKADEVGEMFHCQMFELTAVYAGRLS